VKIIVDSLQKLHLLNAIFISEKMQFKMQHVNNNATGLISLSKKSVLKIVYHDVMYRITSLSIKSVSNM